MVPLFRMCIVYRLITPISFALLYIKQVANPVLEVRHALYKLIWEDDDFVSIENNKQQNI